MLCILLTEKETFIIGEIIIKSLSRREMETQRFSLKSGHKHFLKIITPSLKNISFA